MAYHAKSHEELRWEDYQLGDKDEELLLGSTVFETSIWQLWLRQSPFGSQRGGSRVAPYTPTIEADSGTQAAEKLVLISAMPVYKDKSHEELRWEDYQLGDKGGPLPAGQAAAGIGFGSSPASSSPLGTSPTFGQSSFGVSNAPVFGSSAAFWSFKQPYFWFFNYLYIWCLKFSRFWGFKYPILQLWSSPAFGQSTSAFGSSPFGTTPTTFGAQSGPLPAGQAAAGIGFGSSPASSSLLGPSPTFGQSSSGPFSTSIPSNPFAPKAPSVGGLSFGTSTAPTFSSSPFGASILSGLFGSSLPTSSTFGVGSSPSIFGCSSPLCSSGPYFPSFHISLFYMVRVMHDDLG
ncbi:Nuclear pore complex protein Nup98-Nup96 [Morella rubra]|uniref:Nuclear pore complex protein Nup98-Nup96 n=1 Tax=Morella rubra TaxID=262757 RepID=A0A6A1VU35_9ROSI|nr:Nuclear pore complex protein Nup98-Nup96 [Morella rubra]